jgi:hypothetical protein
MWMGTLKAQSKGVLPWLVRLTPRFGTRDFCPALAALVSPEQTIFFLTVHYYHLRVPIAGSRAGSPVFFRSDTVTA